MDLDDVDVDVLVLSGELDLSGVPRLEARLAQFAETGRVLVVDMAQVTFIGAAVIGTLVEARSNGAILRLRSVPRSIRRVLSIAAVEGLLPEVPASYGAADMPTGPLTADGASPAGPY